MNSNRNATAVRPLLLHNHQLRKVRMRRNAIGSGISQRGALWTFLILVGLYSFAPAQTKQPARSGSQASGVNDSAATRGEYIVNNVAVCSQCHTPRDSEGRPERAHWLEGAALWLQSAEPVVDWPLRAPRIGGSLPGTDDEMITLLTTGIWRTGTYLRPPMPQFRMTRQDAEAVVAYLKTVKPAAK
jgi:mono/diheme cytochrome c family protein